VSEKTPFVLETEAMIKEITKNAEKRAAMPPPRITLPGAWAPSELWPGEDYMHVNSRFTDYRLT